MLEVNLEKMTNLAGRIVAGRCLPSVEISSHLKKGLRSAIKVEPARSVTDANGELEITITALHKGIGWIAWAVPNDKGVFEFSKKAYDTGKAWGMFVEVR